MSSERFTLPTRLDAASGIDLHMHSTASDGAFSPTDLVHLAAARGVKFMALTDHDTLAGVDEACAAGRAAGVAVLPGVEVSSQWQGVGIHIVALLPQAPGDILLEGLARQAEARLARNEEVARRLEKAGFSDAWRKAQQQAGERTALGRPDFARAMVEEGLVPDMKTAFRKYLGAGKVGDVKQPWPGLSAAIDWIVAGGGIALVAHPLRYRLTRKKLTALLDDAGAAGAAGAELVSGFQNEDQGRDLAQILTRRSMMGSLGSDFHFQGGPVAPGRFGAIPRTALPPVWTHPRLSEWCRQNGLSDADPL
ncbi:PHP domain-containing protein [Larsenimonas rhizosphaerae]|uniref:PHP domain-containing protein n=1 Tax=Larsenimonas rhizosphaerae TaxID=2944682 RepID=A0AA41ZL27_9GAMM|nr:PHP domain-containing protein [Larsenimonas rhizosphaerae]MCX2522720.1 PHP domain-containing protein [Larsenimonas rhizosphaerae]